MNTAGFSDTSKLEMVINDIRRYQNAYINANNKPKGILVRWKSGWFCIGKGELVRYVRPTEFRNMTDRLENIATKNKAVGNK
jgi:hypothetical protein